MIIGTTRQRGVGVHHQLSGGASLLPLVFLGPDHDLILDLVRDRHPGTLGLDVSQVAAHFTAAGPIQYLCPDPALYLAPDPGPNRDHDHDHGHHTIATWMGVIQLEPIDPMGKETRANLIGIHGVRQKMLPAAANPGVR
jgi:hypothetical protein